MALLSLLKMFFCDCYKDLYLIGKIILAPILFVFCILCIPLGIFEFLIIDIWALLLCALSRNLTVKDMFDYFFDRW